MVDSALLQTSFSQGFIYWVTKKSLHEIFVDFLLNLLHLKIHIQIY